MTGIKLTVDLSKYRHQELVDGAVGTTFKNNVNRFRAMSIKSRSESGRAFGVEGSERLFDRRRRVSIAGKVVQDSLSAFALQELDYATVTFQSRACGNNRYRPEITDLIKPGSHRISVRRLHASLFWSRCVRRQLHSCRACPALEDLTTMARTTELFRSRSATPTLKSKTSDGVNSPASASNGTRTCWRISFTTI